MSTKSVSEKLFIRPNTTLVFADDSDSLRRVLDEHRGELAAPKALWCSIPRRTGPM